MFLARLPQSTWGSAFKNAGAQLHKTNHISKFQVSTVALVVSEFLFPMKKFLNK